MVKAKAEAGAGAEAPAILWNPAQGGADRTRLADFVRFLEARKAVDVGGFDHAAFLKLHGWSIQNSGEFWNAVWDFAGIIVDKGAGAIEEIKTVPWARFFPDSKISYAENLLFRVHKKPEDPAIMARTQNHRSCFYPRLCQRL